jgi:hypothetical protein
MKPNHILRNNSDQTKLNRKKKNPSIIKETNLFTDILGKLNITIQSQEKF